MNQPATTDYPTTILETDLEARKAVFSYMLYELERAGKCREVFHRLALVLFGDSLGDW